MVEKIQTAMHAHTHIRHTYIGMTSTSLFLSLPLYAYVYSMCQMVFIPALMKPIQINKKQTGFTSNDIPYTYLRAL